MNSFLEVSSLSLIHKGLRRTEGQNKALEQRIKDLIKGPEHSNKENPSTSSNQARNISFELVIAAHFAAAGYSINLSTEADLSIEDVGKILFVECKRPQSKKRIEENVHTALKQLTRRYDESEFNGDKRGFIALSISKVLNPDQLLLSGIDEQELRGRMIRVVNEFIEKYRYLWINPNDKRTIGLVLHLHTPAEVRSEGAYFTTRQITIDKITVEGTPDDDYLNEIGKRIEQALQVLHP
jgi:hypothetical protein